MGNANQTGNRDQSQTIQTIKGWPLLFHQTHSTNVQLSPDQRRAKRLETFCNGICFSNRPVSIGEQVILRFAEVSTSWSGVLRFGFTSHDPSSIDAAGLPRYACPDLTNKYGYWAKALPERFALQGNILCFHVCRNGSVMYAINGEDKGLFFGGIAVGQPLWALIDIYGNSTSVEFIDPRLILSLPLKDNCSPTLTSTSNFFAPLEQGQQVHQGQRAVIGQQVMAHSLKHNQTHQEHQTNNLNLHHYNQQQQRSLMALGGRTTDRSAGLPDATSAPRSATPPVRHHKNLSPLPFHCVVGKNVRLSPDRLVATRVADEYCNGYVFSSRPFKPGEKIVVQILSLDEIFTGGIAFGMTSCDVSLLSPGDLPDDADLLLDRPEYWVVNKDVCSNPAIGDELSFLFTNEGEIKYGKNGFNISTLMHVDKEVKLWAFFDVYGNAQRIRVLGVAAHSIQSSAINTNQQQQLQQQQQQLQQQLQQQQGVQYHQNLIEEIFQPSFTLNSELTYHRGNIHNPLVQLPSVCPQQREENTDNAPPRPPPPIKKPAIPQPQQIPALPPKQVRSGAVFEERLGTRNSPSSGIVQSQPLSPSRGALPYDALSVSSLDNSESGDSRHLFSCQNSSYLQFKEMQPAACRDQGLHRFPIAPKSAPPIQRPPVTAPKPTSLLRPSATFKTPNRRLENASLPATSAEFPPYFATSPRLSDRILALTQHRTMKERAPPTPTPRSSIGDVNTSRSDPTVRKNIQRVSTTPNSEVATSMDVDGDASALGTGSNDPSAQEESLSSSGEIRENNECSVCWERIPDCALYTCGHMCMCYDCALALKESRDAQCPICRQPIKDIIKIYRS